MYLFLCINWTQRKSPSFPCYGEPPRAVRSLSPAPPRCVDSIKNYNIFHKSTSTSILCIYFFLQWPQYTSHCQRNIILQVFSVSVPKFSRTFQSQFQERLSANFALLSFISFIYVNRNNRERWKKNRALFHKVTDLFIMFAQRWVE